MTTSGLGARGASVDSAQDAPERVEGSALGTGSLMVSASAPVFDAARIRADFPILRRKARGKPLVYLDNAATTQKPQVVLDAIVRYYTELNANVHRGVHELSEVATDAYEAARDKVRWFLNARERGEIVFTRNATESINLVAFTFGRANLSAGDEVVISAMEHHSNIVPWQLL
jgi:cysteine desulfurase/selenocysteine lyase